MDCKAGGCDCHCEHGGCGCIASSEDPNDCDCHCYHDRLAIVKGGKKIPFKTFKPKTKATYETKFDICTRDLPIGALAEILDKRLPNQIVVPAAKATEIITLSLKNKTLKQIINRSGLALKS